MASYVTLNLSDRIAPIGAFPNSKVREYLKRGHQSALYREILFVVKEFYPNSALNGVVVKGDAIAPLEEHLVLEHYAPAQAIDGRTY